MPIYRKNPKAVYTLRYHFVWCPKFRRPVLVGPVAERLKTLLSERAEAVGLSIRTMEVMPHYVYLVVDSDPTWAPAGIAACLKGYTSRILREEFPHLRSRLPTIWSRSYFVGTAGLVSQETIRRYVDDQKNR
jgi:putative transposase